MSKPVKEMIVAEYKRRFDDVTSGLLIDIRGIEANVNNELRVDLQQQDIHITVLKNSLAKTAFQDTELEGLADLIEGPSALAFGGNSVVEVARSLVKWAKKIKKLELKQIYAKMINSHFLIIWIKHYKKNQKIMKIHKN